MSSGPSNDDVTAVLAANAAFYAAFEAGDLDAMSDVWIHDETVTCVHPGWTRLDGWARIAASWFALFDGPQRLQFIVTNEGVRVVGDAAWVHCDENLIDGERTSTIAAINVFERRDGRWLLAAHHGAGVASR